MTTSTYGRDTTELHLLEWQRRKLRYIKAVRQKFENEGPGRQTTLTGKLLTKVRPFSEPFDPKGYNASVISHDLIAEIYLNWAVEIRASESAAYLRTLTGT